MGGGGGVNYLFNVLIPNCIRIHMVISLGGGPNCKVLDLIQSFVIATGHVLIG